FAMEIKQELRADQENVANPEYISQDSILESQYVTTVSKYEGHRG
ncbi:10723_t:CDS:1, partial [Scutellospora calospora]